MAHITPPIQDHIHKFAKVAHECFVSWASKKESVPTYTMLLPNDTVIGSLDALEISPLHRLHAPKADDHYITVPLRGTPLMMFGFIMEGDLYDHLRNMTLPRSALALSLSSETWMRCLKTDNSGEPIGDIKTVEPITGWNTIIIDRDTHTYNLLSFNGEEGMLDLETTSTGGRTVMAMKQMMVRSQK